MTVPTRVINARDVRNNLGFNSGRGGLGTDYVSAMDYMNFRYLRFGLLDYSNDSNQGKTFSDLCVSNGLFDPNIHLQILVDAYWDNKDTVQWTSVQIPYLNTVLQPTYVNSNNGTKIFSSIEGPNEVGQPGQGGGTYNGFDQALGGDNLQVTDASSDATCRAAYVNFAQGVHNHKVANPSLYVGTEVVGPSILGDGPGPDNAWGGLDGVYGTSMKIDQYVDYGCYHAYNGANTDGTTMGHNPNRDPSTHAWGYWAYIGQITSQTGSGSNRDPTTGYGLVLSEGNSFQLSNGYATDLVSSAWGTLLYLCDVFGIGGRRVLFYTIAEDGRGLGMFSTTPWVEANAFPRATVCRNWQSLVSVGNNYKDTRNLADSGKNPPAFVPNYTGSGFSVVGMDQPGDGANAMIMPKSDGTTMIVIWREQHPIDSGTSSSTSANEIGTANNVTVNFGSTQTYNTWDPSGGTGGNTTTITSSPTKLTGPITGSSVVIPLYNVPIFIELIGVSVTQAPATPAGVSVTKTSATSATIGWTGAAQGAINTPATYNLQIQQGTSTGTWTTVATNVPGTANSYTFVGLQPSIQYFYRLSATNSIGTSGNSTSVNSTTTANQSVTTPVIVQTNRARSDGQAANTPVTLSLSSQPGANNSFYVFFNGYEGAGNSNAITAPTGSTVLLQNKALTSEVMWVWKVPYSSSNSWTFSNFDSTNNAGWRIVEVTSGVSEDVNSAEVTSATASAISWPLVAPTYTNCVRLSYLSLQFAATIGAGSAGTAVIAAGTDPATVTFHQGVLLSETATTASPVSLAITGGTVNDTDAYANLNIYGNVLPAATTLTSSNLTNTSIALSWTAIPAVTTANNGSYSVQISTDSGTTWTNGLTAITVPAGGATNVTISTLQAQTPYQFRVVGNNSSGQGTPSNVISATTLAQPALAYIQNAIATDQTGAGTMTVTFANATQVGSTLVFWVAMELSTTNSALKPPVTITTGNVQVLPTGVTGTSQVGSMMMWTQTVTTAASSYAFTGYTGTGTLMAVEVRGVSSIQTPTSNAQLTFANGAPGSITLPVTAATASPALGFYGVNMQFNPDLWSTGSFPQNVVGLNAITGNSATPTNQFHCGLLVEVTSPTLNGNQTLPNSLGAGETQATNGPPSVTYNPMMIGVNLLGATTNIKPGGTTLVFGTATPTTQPLSWAAASGTVTSYEIKYSTSPNMT